MIFKTKNNELAIFGQTLSDVKKKLIDFNEIWMQGGKFGSNKLQLIPEQNFIKELSLDEAEQQLKSLNQFVGSGKMTYEQYFNTIGKGNTVLRTYVTTTDQQSQSVQGLIKASQEARAAQLAHNEAIKAQTLGAKAAAVGLGILRTAGNILAMWGISKGIQLISDLVTASDRLKESAKDLGSQFSSTKSDVESYKEKITDLYKVINDNSSSYEDTYNARQELLSIQDEMIDKFGSEAEAVNLVTTAINGQVEALDKLTAKQWQEAVNSFNNDSDRTWTEKIADNWSNMWFGVSSNYDRMIKEMENTKISFSIIPSNDDTYKEFSKKLKELYGASLDKTERSDIFTLTGNLDTVYNKLIDIQSLASDMGIDSSWMPDLGRQAEEAKNKLADYQEFYSQAILNDRILVNEDYADSFKSINNAYHNYQKAFSEGDKQSIESAKQAFSEIVHAATDGISDENIIDFFNSMYPDLQEIVGSWEFEVKFNAAINDNNDDFEARVNEALSSFDKSDDIVNYKSTVNTIDYDTATDVQKNMIDNYHELVSIADEYGLTLEQLIVKLENMGLISSQAKDDLLNKLIPSYDGLTAGLDNYLRDALSQVDPDIATEWVRSLSKEETKLANSKEFEQALEEQKRKLNGATLSADDYSTALQNINSSQDNLEDKTEILSISSTVDKLNTQLKPAMESLADVYHNVFTEDGFTLDNVDLSAFESIKSKLDDIAKFNPEIDLSAFEDFVTTLNNTESTSEEVKTAFDALATSIVDAGVDGIEDFQLLKDTLQEMGVQNFEMVAFEELIKNTEALKASGLDLANATETQIKAFAEEVENVSQAYDLLLYSKQLCSLQEMNTAGEVANLKTLAENAGITGNVIIWLTELEKIYQEVASGFFDPSNPFAINGKIARATILKGLIDNAATGIKFNGNEVDYKPLTKAAKKSGKDAGKEYLDALKDELSKLDDVLSYINDTIGDQIDLYNDQKDAAVDALEAQKDAAADALEAQIDLVEAQIEGIESQIKAKEKEIEIKQDEIAAIKEAREERQREIDLQKKQFDLERMQNQKTRLIYKGEPGQMVYETDTAGIRDAREAVNEVKEDIQIAKIEKEISLIENEIDSLEEEISGLESVIDSLNEQIDASNKYFDDLIKSTESYYDNIVKGLEEYQSRWAEIGKLEEQAKIQVLLQELGITTDDILNMSGEAFDKFKQQYLGILTEIYSGNDQMITALNQVADGIDLAPLNDGLTKTKENIDNIQATDISSISGNLNAVSESMDNVGNSALVANDNTSAIADNIQELNTNTNGLDSKLNNISSALTSIPDGTKIEGLVQSFTNLGEAIKNVADALGVGEEGSIGSLVGALSEISNFTLEGEEGAGIISQFRNLKSAIEDTTSAISGGAESNQGGDASNSASPSMSAGNPGTGEGGLTGAIDSIKTTTDEVLGSGGDGEGEGSGDGVIGRFEQFKSAVDAVTSAIGTGEEDDEAENTLISALQANYETAETTLPEVKNFFDELLSSIVACVNSLNEMGQAISELSTIGVSGISVNAHSKGTVGTAFEEGTVGKAFAKGTGKYKGLPKAEKNALRSEYGQPELTVYPDGTTELTTEPTMSDLPKDTVIFNEEQTKRIMNNKGTIVGNVYKEGSADDGVIVTKDGSVLRPLREGDAFYEIMKKAQNYFEKQTNPIISPVMAIDKNVEAITKTLNSVNNVTNTQQAVSVGEVHIHCPGITKDEVAQQIGHELNRTFSGLSLDARQRASITR